MGGGGAGGDRKCHWCIYEFNSELGLDQKNLPAAYTSTLQSKAIFYSSKIRLPTSPLKYITPKPRERFRIEMKSGQE